MLYINNITKTYHTHGMIFTALDGVTFHVGKGDFIVVVGPSGSGKSTLLHTIGGLIRPDSGEVLFNGSDVYSMAPSASNNYRKKCIGFVFQQFHLVPWLTVYENIKLVCDDTISRDSIDGHLNQCALYPLRNKYPSELSVGEKQRTAFVRAIIPKPQLLLADEPTGNLDPQNAHILMTLIEGFHREGGTVLLVSHHPEPAKYARQMISLNSGHLA